MACAPVERSERCAVLTPSGTMSPRPSLESPLVARVIDTRRFWYTRARTRVGRGASFVPRTRVRGSLSIQLDIDSADAPPVLPQLLRGALPHGGWAVVRGDFVLLYSCVIYNRIVASSTMDTQIKYVHTLVEGSLSDSQHTRHSENYLRTTRPRSRARERARTLSLSLSMDAGWKDTRRSDPERLTATTTGKIADVQEQRRAMR